MCYCLLVFICISMSVCDVCILCSLYVFVHKCTQLCGGFADTMIRCAELISIHTLVDFIDINVGCPIDLVFKMVGVQDLEFMIDLLRNSLQGAGSALMTRHTRFESIVHGMAEVS